ncbi:MAG: hypothetical protein U0Q16_03195 [Bryobacteraceae bacterium]
MFTDDMVTPTRLEVLIDVLRDYGRREWSRADLVGVLQPKGLPDLSPNSKQAEVTIRAAKELGIVTEESQVVRLSRFEKDLSTRQLLLEVLDDKVLGSTEIEFFYAPFYSYLLSLNADGAQKLDGDQWAIGFARDCPAAARTENAFNKPKYTGLNRWYPYSGHGWFDSEGVFQPNPYERVCRRLDRIFGTERKLSGDEFFSRVARDCAELDGGEIFCRAVAAYDRKRRIATQGLSHALIDLHADGVIRLICPPDSRGWSIEAAQPYNDGKTLLSGRIDYVEYCC